MIDHKRGIIQIHIPKTGGLSLRRAIFNKHKTDRYMHITPDHKRLSKYWNNYYTFTFVRNPFDRLLSIYSFTLDTKNPFSKANKPFIIKLRELNPSFKEFVTILYKNNILKNLQRFLPQVNWIKSEKKEFKFNFIGKFENFENDYLQLCKNLNITNLPILPKINKSNNRKKDYREYYTKDMIKKISEMYSEDLKRFNYKF